MAYDASKLKTQIKETEEWLSRELAGVRTGRATPTLLDSIKPEVYGARTPLNQVGSVSIEDARTLRIVPWDKSSIKAIEKAVIEADLGVGVATDDQGLRVTFPELTAERRTLLTKLANEKHEQAKVTLRGHRTDAIKEIEGLQKEGMGEDQAKRDKEEVQKLIDAANTALEALAKKKADEIAQ
ncbi:MAG TPA: ribosome recycling factor [Candidatus Paceibacterota bacterium]|nr:ribosome recycling factor [Candidatus Paceibacterota bacterium]